MIFVSLTFGGLGCRRTKSPASAPEIIRSAAQWENNNNNKQLIKKKGRGLYTRGRSTKTPAANVVVDVPDVCCRPPGIGSASDVAARPNKIHNAHNKSRLMRRAATTEEVSAAQANVCVDREFHRSHNSRGTTPQFVMFHHGYPMHTGSYDRLADWRLDVDSMSYEQLLALGDRIGQASRGLKEEEILNFLTKSKHSNFHAFSSLEPIGKDFRCTICQEGWTADDDVGRLDCGHVYHADCIKQWLLQKNTCPVCKNAAISKRNN